jgi:hypothetical protein
MRAVLCLAIWAQVASAQEEPIDKRELARTLYSDGTEEYAAGKYRDAARHFSEAYALTALPALLFNQAQALRLVFEGEHDRAAGQRALQLYDRYLAMTSLSPADRKEPTGRRAALAQALAPPASPPAQKPRRRVGLWVGIGVGAAAVVGLAVGLGVGLSSGGPGAPTVTARW